MSRRFLSCAALMGVGLTAASPPVAHAVDCPAKETVKLAGLDWSSARFHNAVARLILEKGYGCSVETVPSTTITSLRQVERGDVHVVMEVWYANNPAIWDRLKAAGKVVEPGGISITRAVQGFYVPRYVIEGDKKRGIKPMAPNLRSVDDLKKYAHVFEDVEQSPKGRFYNCKLGWTCERVNTKKLQAYGLNKYYTNYRPGSGEALSKAIADAYRRGKPVLAYYWGPTWVLGKYDLVRLKEPAYDPKLWTALARARSGRQGKATAYPAIKVIVGMNAAFAKSAPALTTFLSRYRMTGAAVAKALVYMRENRDRDGSAAARHFLKNNPAPWKKWVPADVAARIKAAL